MRDDFTQATAQQLAKRVGFRCSNPECRKPTSGPGADGGTVNLGVAAHITAASEGGPRYDGLLTSQARRDAENGIWLCQQCSRLIDADASTYEAVDLEAWKDFAEAAAKVELRGYVVRKGRNFATLEAKLPELVAEMRADLILHPLVRELIALSKRVSYNSGPALLFQYHYETHDHLLSKIKICQNYGALVDITFNEVPRWNFTEDFVEYLLGE